jgi:hypothetical protein
MGRRKEEKQRWVKWHRQQKVDPMLMPRKKKNLRYILSPSKKMPFSLLSLPFNFLMKLAGGSKGPKLAVVRGETPERGSFTH